MQNFVKISINILLTFCLWNNYYCVLCENNVNCGGTFSGYQYTINSPNYPNEYPMNQNCQYYLHGMRQARCEQEFHLQFLDLDIRASEKCEKDYLQIGESNIYCGKNAGLRIFKGQKNVLKIHFHSGLEKIGAKGFRILVTTLPCVNTQHKQNVTSTHRQVASRQITPSGKIETSYTNSHNDTKNDKNLNFQKSKSPLLNHKQLMVETLSPVYRSQVKFPGENNFSRPLTSERKQLGPLTYLFLPPTSNSMKISYSSRNLTNSQLPTMKPVENFSLPIFPNIPFRVSQTSDKSSSALKMENYSPERNYQTNFPSRIHGLNYGNENQVSFEANSGQFSEFGSGINFAKSNFDFGNSKPLFAPDYNFGTSSVLNSGIGWGTGITRPNSAQNPGIGNFGPVNDLENGSGIESGSGFGNANSGSNSGVGYSDSGIGLENNFEVESDFSTNNNNNNNWETSSGTFPGIGTQPSSGSNSGIDSKFNFGLNSGVGHTGPEIESGIGSGIYSVKGHGSNFRFGSGIYSESGHGSNLGSGSGIYSGIGYGSNAATGSGIFLGTGSGVGYGSDLGVSYDGPGFEAGIGPEKIPDIDSILGSGIDPNYPAWSQPASECCKSSIPTQRSIIVSPGFPNLIFSSAPYECGYTIYKSSPASCQLRLYLKFFNFGIDDPFCRYGSLSINGRRICGCKTNLNLVFPFGNFPAIVINVEYQGFPKSKFNGFLIELIQENCDNDFPLIRNRKDLSASLLSLNETFVGELKHEFGNLSRSINSHARNKRETKEEEGYFYARPSSSLSSETGHASFNAKHSSAFGRSERLFFNSCQNRVFLDWILAAKEAFITGVRCPDLRNSRHLINVIPKEWNRYPGTCEEIPAIEGVIFSPLYPNYYPNFVRKCYRFHRAPGFCQLEVSILDFNLEASLGCANDFLVFSGQNKRYCGDSLLGTTTVFDLSRSKVAEIYFKTDAVGSGRGFIAGFVQKAC